MERLTGKGRLSAAMAGLVVIVAMLIAACGGSSGTSHSPGEATDSVSWAEQPGQAPNWIWPYPQIGTNGTNNIELGLLYLISTRLETTATPTSTISGASPSSRPTAPTAPR